MLYSRRGRLVSSLRGEMSGSRHDTPRIDVQTGVAGVTGVTSVGRELGIPGTEERDRTEPDTGSTYSCGQER